MAVFWVQRYYPLPIIYENFGMGEELSQRRQQESLISGTDSRQRGVSPSGSLPYSGTPASQQHAMEFETFPTQSFGMEHYSGASPFNMASMTNGLPDYQVRGYAQQPFVQHYSPNPAMFHQQQGAQFAGQNTTTFNQPFAQQYPSASHPSQQQRQQMQYLQYAGANLGLHGSPQSFQQHHYYQPHTNLQNLANAIPQPAQSYFQQPGPGTFGVPYGARATSGYSAPQMRSDGNGGLIQGAPMFSQIPPRNLSRHSSDSSMRPAIPRGPPRKPKQSGHALWVGNLPPGTNVIDLKDHFSRDATAEIESVFLISKSNCAFVNYKTELACSMAMSRFHDSRFQGVRLVCRLRRGSAPTSATTPTGPANVQEIGSSDQPQEAVDEHTPAHEVVPAAVVEEPPEKVKEKFFIVKSLTIEDLELSARNGIWATQAHNEAALNKAYLVAENVYLIFSANKSGEYFGYARMASSIDDEAVSVVDHPVKPEASAPNPADLPITIPTAATATAPKGHIIDDSARGTIFWEAEVDEVEEQQKPEDVGNVSGESEDLTAVNSTNLQTFGKPFKIVWMSTEKLPFYRTRGLRNPWNSNREVKIARDGTELEPSVGRRLVGMFHRPQMPSISPNAARIQPNSAGMPQPQQQHPQPPYWS